MATVMTRQVIGWRARRWNGERPARHLPDAASTDGWPHVDLSAMF